MKIESASTSRGLFTCRGCESSELDLLIDLGYSPVANSLPGLNSSVDEPSYPLELRICRVCFLGQIPEFESPEEIFSVYSYLSSTSSSWLNHAQEFAKTCLLEMPYIADGYVLELASNDGYLLQHFKNLGVDVLGVEPATNVADISRAKGIPTIEVFFGKDQAEAILTKYGYPMLIVANNVAAHVPNMIDFFSGISVLCGPKTMVSIENPSLGFLLSKGFYDTIYHEHFSYLSVTPIKHLVSRLGMILCEAEILATHGGSIRYWITKNQSLEIDNSVYQIEQDEYRRGLGNLDSEIAFASKVQTEIKELSNWLSQQDSGSVIGYGAAAKTVTTFFAAGLPEDRFKMIVDANPLKQGKRLPGTSIPILGLDSLASSSAKKILIFAWNLEEEIVKVIRKYNTDIEIWVPNPIRLARE